MASQQIVFAETVASLKKALKRKAYESDSDDSIDHSSNRGQKLKKRARFTSQGQLAPPLGPEVYKEEVTFAGVNRYILSRNPPLIDDDGFEVDSDDDEERIQDAAANAADLNPYSDIRLEELLAPLTAVTDLPNHPTLSPPLTSNMIKQLATQASEIMRKEQNALWRARKLLTGLCGDFTWIPCGPLVGPNDIELYTDDSVLQNLLKKRSEPNQGEGSSGDLPNGEPKPSVNGSSSAGAGTLANLADGQEQNGEDVAMVDADAPAAGKSEPSDGVDKEGPEPQKDPDGQNNTADEDKKEEAQIPNSEKRPAEQDGDSGDKPSGDGKRSEADPAQPADNNVEMQDADPAPQPNAEPSPRPEADKTQLYAAPHPGDDEPFIHPFFTPPSHPLPDRDMGLPDPEAENVRHLMSLYVQKQEEICRGAMRLYLGLLRADQRREEVLRWAKAEAHVGELSDGEDWYDREEYGLSEDLKKGQDEEEEDTTTTAKKTRNRRQ